MGSSVTTCSSHSRFSCSLVGKTEEGTSFGLRWYPPQISPSVSQATGPPEFLGVLPGSVKKRVAEFLDKNRGALLLYWDGRLNTREVLDLIQKV